MSHSIELSGGRVVARPRARKLAPLERVFVDPMAPEDCRQIVVVCTTRQARALAEFYGWTLLEAAR